MAPTQQMWPRRGWLTDHMCTSRPSTCLEWEWTSLTRSSRARVITFGQPLAGGIKHKHRWESWFLSLLLHIALLNKFHCAHTPRNAFMNGSLAESGQYDLYCLGKLGENRSEVHLLIIPPGLVCSHYNRSVCDMHMLDHTAWVCHHHLIPSLTRNHKIVFFRVCAHLLFTT